MKIVRSLRAGPDGQLSIGILDGDRSMLLDGKMGVALKEKSVFEHFIGLGKAFFDVAEFQRHEFVDVSLFAVIVDARFGSCEGFFGIGDGREDFIVDIDQVKRLESRQLLSRYDCSDGVSDVAHAVDTKGLLVLADGENSVLNGNVFARKHEMHSGVSGGARRIDFSDARMRMRRTK